MGRGWLNTSYIGILDCCCTGILDSSTGMPQSTKRCPLSPWYAAAPRSRERSTDTSRRQDESIGSLKAMKTCKYQCFQQNAWKVKENPNTLKTHPKILSPWKRWKLANTHILHFSIHHQQSHKFHVLLASATHLYEKDISLGRKWVPHHQQHLIWTVGWSVM